MRREIGVATEADSEEVEDFALKVVGGGPDRSDAFDDRAGAIETNLEANALLLRDR